MCTAGCKLLPDRIIAFKNLDVEENETGSGPKLDTSGKIPVIMFPRTEKKPGTVIGASRYLQIYGLDSHVPRFDKIPRSKEEIKHDAHGVGIAFLKMLQTSENIQEGILNLQIWYRKLYLESPDMMVLNGVDRRGTYKMVAVEFDPMARKSWIFEVKDAGDILRTNHFKIQKSGSTRAEDPDSYARYETANAKMHQAQSVADFIKMLRCHAGPTGDQYSICRHRQKIDDGSPRYLTGEYHTVLSVILEQVFSTSEISVHYTTGNPCQTEYKTERFQL
jgi:hypothetical protein